MPDARRPGPVLALRDATDADAARILALNDAEVAQTSAMDRARLRALAALAAYHRVAVVDGTVVAFLLAMRDDAAYANENFGWFAARLPAFAYVDRIVVDAAFAGRGIGAALYRDLFAWAGAHGIPTLACEYTLVPPNPASRAFHDRFGFREIGRQHVAGGSKRVSLQVADVASVPPADGAGPAPGRSPG
jgi:predicted GNAT superfamily acetyltransferase